MLGRALDLPASDTEAFSDDDATVFNDDLNALHAAGIIKGCNPPIDDAVCPEQAMTRAELVTLLHRAELLGHFD